MRDGNAPLRTAQEVVQWLTQAIYSGVWLPDTKLPPERTLATDLGINRSTVAAAYDELQALGMVDRRQGSGTFVHGDLWGVTPDWTRYLSTAAFRPTEPLVQTFRDARGNPGTIDFTQADLGPELWPTRELAQLWPAVDLASVVGYPPPLGHGKLREALAVEMMRQYRMAVNPETILITSGAQQALYLIARALLRPGTAIAIEQPSFYYSLSLFQSIGVRLLPILTDGQGLLPDALSDLMKRHRPAMIWLNPTYHNPTGTILPLARRQAVLSLAERWQVPVVEDDAFAHLRVKGAPSPPVPLRALGDDKRVLFIGTLSKIAAPGLRVGWIVAPRAIITRLADIKGQMDLGTPGLVQVLAASLLRSPAWPLHLNRVEAVLRQRRDAFCAALEPLGRTGARWTVPDGGLYVWLRWGDHLPDRVRLLQAIAAGVVFAPGRVYGADDGSARLNYVFLPEERAAMGLQRLAAL
ncbi:MAG: PLP-dependent aminotransferase family protein [Thermaerobacter sp.]|nr:PLP-dependent aminotransferase family protein [Thermaerobacter sp.]